MTQINQHIASVTERIIKRSADLRAGYLVQIAEDHNNRPERGKLSCGNLAHGFAACGDGDKNSLRLMEAGNMAIILPTTTCFQPTSPMRFIPIS